MSLWVAMIIGLFIDGERYCIHRGPHGLRNLRGCGPTAVQGAPGGKAEGFPKLRNADGARSILQGFRSFQRPQDGMK